MYHANTLFCPSREYFSFNSLSRVQTITPDDSRDLRATRNVDMEVYIKTVLVARWSVSPEVTILKRTAWQLRYNFK
jgi:hypothetical protein